ncbi:MAG: hypothetical protein VW455_06770 [Nitrospinota bacterium]
MSKTVLAIIYSVLTIIVFIIDLNTELGIAGGILYVSVIALCLLAKDKHFFVAFGLAGIILTIAGYFFSPGGVKNTRCY